MNSKSLFPLYALALTLTSGCVDSLSEERRPCPCTDGWTCCASTQTCVADGTACPSEEPKEEEGPPDVVPPAVPVLRASIPGSPTSSATAALDGTTEPGAAVALFTTADCSGTPVGSGTADAAGGFRISVPLPPNTTTSFWARATDAARNASRCSVEPVPVLHDGVAPERPLLESLTPGPLSRTSTHPVLAGIAEPSSTVRLFADAECLTALPFSATADDVGAFRVWASVGADTTTSFHARAVDAAGNGSACSAAGLAFTHDATPPSAPALTGPTGPLNRAEPDATGTTEPGATVRLFAQEGCAGDSVAEGAALPDGTFAMRFAVKPDTSNTLSAQATDAAGNNSACSAAHTFVHDGTAPSGTWELSVSPASPTNATTTPVVSGSAEPGGRVRVLVGYSCYESYSTTIFHGVADDAGRWSIQVEVPANSWRGIYTDVTDAAGNRSPCSTGIIFTHDSTPPPPPTLLGTSAPTPTTVDGPLRVRGLANTDPGSTVRLYANATCTGPALASTTPSVPSGASPGEFVFQDIPATAESTTAFSATTTDFVGNTSACSTPLFHTHTRGRGWGPVEVPGKVLPTRASVASDGAGRTLAVWSEWVVDKEVVRASFHTPEAGWSEPEVLIGSTYAVDDDSLSVAVAPTGHALVAWPRSVSSRWRVFARRFIPGQGWLPEEELGSANTPANVPTVDLDAAGNAVAVWYEGDTSGSASELWTRRATPEGTWEAPQRLATGVWSTWKQNLSVAANGEAWTFWTANTNSSELLGRHYVPGSGWGETERPLDGFTLSYTRVTAAVGATGELVLAALGRRTAESRNGVWVRQYAPGQGWREPRALYEGAESPELPRVAINARGEAVVAWVRPLQPASLWASQYSADTGWSPATKLQRGLSALYDVQVSIDDTGAALVGWVQSQNAPSTVNDSRWLPWVARFKPAVGWEPTQLLSDEPSLGYTLLLQADAQGRALALWRKYSSTYNYVTGSRSFR